MFIVDKGVVEVIVDGKAVAQMKEGSCFGNLNVVTNKSQKQFNI
jgi:hypothetical protein